MKADPRLISGQHPLAHAPEHLLCTPLSLEQAVCLSSLHVGGRNTDSKELHKTASAAFDILDQQDPDFAQLAIATAAAAAPAPPPAPAKEAIVTKPSIGGSAALLRILSAHPHNMQLIEAVRCRRRPLSSGEMDSRRP